MRHYEISWDMTSETSWLKRIEHWLRIAACVKARFNEHDCVSFCFLHKPACHGRLLANHLASHLFLKNLLEKNSYKKLRKQLFSCFGIDFYNSLVLGMFFFLMSKFFAQPLQNFPRSTPRWEEASGRRKESKKTNIFLYFFLKRNYKTNTANFVWQNKKLWQKTCDLIRQIDKNSVKRSICHKISVCERCDGSKKKTLNDIPNTPDFDKLHKLHKSPTSNSVKEHQPVHLSIQLQGFTASIWVDYRTNC